MFKRLVPITVAVLALAPVAWAGHDRYAPPAPNLAELAHELENATRHVHRSAEHDLHPHNRWNREAMSLLHELETRARHFHREVERGHSPRHLERDFFRLLDAYDAAAYSVAHLRSGHIRRDFRRVDRLMSELEYRMGFRRGHGRYHDSGYDRPRHGRRSHGEIVFGDDRGRTRYEVRVGW